MYKTLPLLELMTNETRRFYVHISKVYSGIFLKFPKLVLYDICNQCAILIRNTQIFQVYKSSIFK